MLEAVANNSSGRVEEGFCHHLPTTSSISVKDSQIPLQGLYYLVQICEHGRPLPNSNKYQTNDSSQNSFCDWWSNSSPRKSAFMTLCDRIANSSKWSKLVSYCWSESMS